ncbi:MAG: 3-hydroxyacyl-CoA dehydrogenase NAD-binding domain-containing protein [Phycisphaerae bacterium]
MAVTSVAVVGAGTMGSGIAQLAATHGCRVRLIDVDSNALNRATRDISQLLHRSAEKPESTAARRGATLGSVSTAESVSDVGDVGLAIEAVVEDLDVKCRVLADLEAAIPVSAILATNTSTLSIGQLAQSLRAPSRLIGMHFFNPATTIPVIEVISGEAEDRTWSDAAMRVARSWGKTPVLTKDTPGFIVNRVARGFYLEALRLLAEGVGGVDEVDQVMRMHGRFQKGPFELMDLVGVDVSLAVTTSIWERMNRSTRLEPHDIQKRLVKHGYLGCKTSRGFYSYLYEAPVPACIVERRSFQISPLMADVMSAFCLKAGAVDAGSTEQYMLCRILGAIINEAALTYDEGVASADDIDLAMVKGATHPRGPLEWADEIGHRTVRGMLKALNASVADGRYKAAPLFAKAR